MVVFGASNLPSSIPVTPSPIRKPFPFTWQPPYHMDHGKGEQNVSGYGVQSKQSDSEGDPSQGQPGLESNGGGQTLD